MSDVFRFPVTVRYFEVDAQNVVFNMWYLGYFDEAFNAFLTHRELPYRQLLAGGTDAQVVHTELDWAGSVGWGDPLTITVQTAAIGRTSFTLVFEAVTGEGDAERVACRGRTVYVAIATDGSGKQPVPGNLRKALGDPT